MPKPAQLRDRATRSESQNTAASAIAPACLRNVGGPSTTAGDWSRAPAATIAPHRSRVRGGKSPRRLTPHRRQIRYRSAVPAGGRNGRDRGQELRHPFEQPDDAHLRRLAMSRHILPALNFRPVPLVVFVSAPKHFLVRQRRPPAQQPLYLTGIEQKVFGDHLVMVRPERRYAQRVRQLHRGNGRSKRKRTYF